MKQFFPLFILLFFVQFADAQNLVVNPSFEDTLHCPYSNSQIGYAIGWSGFSSEYLNSCGYNGFGVPLNMIGFQYPATGNAYCGLIPYLEGNNYREFVQSALDTTLVIGEKYYASFKVNLSSDSFSSISINNIGLLFSTVLLDTLNSAPIRNYSQISSAYVLSDTLHWVLVSGSFVADSAYKYIAVSNFYDNSHTDTINTNPNSGRAFYFIDDICVSADSLGCEMNVGIPTPSPSSLTLYPNPVSSNLTVTGLTEGAAIQITDISGRVIFTSTINHSTSNIDMSAYPEGVYILRSGGEVRKIVRL